MLVLVERLVAPLAALAIIVMIIFVLLLWPLLVSAETLTGRVVGVADGDTITVLDMYHQQHKVRLAGIDAPERKQPFGNRAKQHLSYLVYNKPVSVEYTKRDRWGRVIGKVWLFSREDCPLAAECRRTVDVGLQQVKAGWAWHYKEFESEQVDTDRTLYAESEVQARSLKIGLWYAMRPTPPWEFRRAKRSANRN